MRAGNLARAAELGANRAVDASGDLTRTVRRIVPHGVDAVIDAAVLGIDAHGTLRAGGRFVALVRPIAPPPLRATTTVVQEEVAADGARLTELSAMIDFGLLRLADVHSFPFNAAATARTLGGRPLSRQARHPDSQQRQHHPHLTGGRARRALRLVQAPRILATACAVSPDGLAPSTTAPRRHHRRARDRMVLTYQRQKENTDG